MVKGAGPNTPRKRRQSAKGASTDLHVVEGVSEQDRVAAAAAFEKAQEEEAGERHQNGFERAEAEAEAEIANGKTHKRKTPHPPVTVQKLEPGTAEYNARFIREFIALEELREKKRLISNDLKAIGKDISKHIKRCQLELSGDVEERFNAHRIFQKDEGEEKIRGYMLAWAYAFQLAGLPVGTNADFFPKDRRPAAEIAAHEGYMDALRDKDFNPFKWGNGGDEAHDAYVKRYKDGREWLLERAKEKMLAQVASLTAEEPPPFDGPAPDDQVH